MGVALVSDLSDLSDLSDKRCATVYPEGFAMPLWGIARVADLPQGYAGLF